MVFYGRHVGLEDGVACSVGGQPTGGFVSRTSAARRERARCWNCHSSVTGLGSRKLHERLFRNMYSDQVRFDKSAVVEGPLESNLAVVLAECNCISPLSYQC